MKKSVSYMALAMALPLGGWFFHNHLTKSVPAADASVKESPKQVRLWFNERPEVSFSSITVLGPDSTKLDVIGKAQATDDTLSVAADLTKPLAKGHYTIVWRTAGKDGHAVRGRYGFSVE